MVNQVPGNPDIASTVRIILWPGEGFVAEIDTDYGQQMFTLQGLQWYVLDLKRRGLPAAIEEAALQMLSSAHVDNQTDTGSS